MLQLYKDPFSLIKTYVPHYKISCGLSDQTSVWEQDNRTKDHLHNVQLKTTASRQHSMPAPTE